MIQVQEARCEEKLATNQLTSLQNEMISSVYGEDDHDVIKWNESMILTKNVEQQRRDAFKELIEKRLNTIPKDGWK